VEVRNIELKFKKYFKSQNMKTLKETIFLLVILALAGSTVSAQFDDLYYEASDDDYASVSYDDYEYDTDDYYAYEEVDEDSYEYFDDYNTNDDYYNGYEYSRRINRFNRGFRTNNYYSFFYTNPLFLDRGYSSRFWYDPFYARSFNNAFLNPYVYGGSGLSININVGNRFQRVNSVDLFYLYNSGAISYSAYRRALNRARFGTFGGFGYGRAGFGGFAGGGFAGNRFGGWGSSAYYCPPISGFSRVANANPIQTGTAARVRNTQVARTRVNQSGYRGRTNVSTRRTGENSRIATARGNSTREVSRNGRRIENSSTGIRSANSRKRTSVTKERTNRRNNSSSIRSSSRRNSSSVRRANTSRRSSGMNSSRTRTNNSLRPSSSNRSSRATRSSGASRSSSARSSSRSSSPRSSSSSRRSSSRKR
jgi:hypothetical protein